MQVILSGKGGALQVGRGSVVGSAIIATGAAMIKATKAASDFNEEVTRSEAVFGGASDAMAEWSKTLADGFGIAQTDALQAANNFGTMFNVIGLGKADAADMSRRLVELAGDMSSMNNADPSDMLDRLRAGLAGEAEPLRRFGVLLSESRVQQEAYATGIARVGAKLTEQQKVQARYQLILKDTAIQQGDAARTSQNFAGQLRELQAQIRNATVALGTEMLPAMTDLLTATNDLIGAVGVLGDLLGKLPHGADRLRQIAADVARAIPFTAALPGLLDAARIRSEEKKRREREAARIAGIHDRPEPWELAGRFRPPPPPRPGITTEQRNQWFDAMIGRRTDRVQDIRTLRGQIAELERINDLIRDRIKVTKDRTRLLNLEGQILVNQRQISAIQEQARAQTEQLREERKALAEERREREKLARENAQFAALGLGPGGQERAPGVDALRRRLNRIEAAFGGNIPAKIKKRLDAIRAVIQKWGKDLTEDVRRAIEGMLASAEKGTGEKRKMVFRAIDPTEMLRGLGLSPEQIRIIRARLSAVGPGGTVPKGGGPAAFGRELTGATVVNVYGDVVTPDPDAFARQMQKRAKRSRGQQRGVRPGVNQGLA